MTKPQLSVLMELQEKTLYS